MAMHRQSQQRGALVLVPLVFAACTSPRGGAQRLDREIQARIAGSSLPSATRSTVDPVPEGVRVWLHEGTVDVDDVGPWAALSEEQLQRATAERSGPPWTHVRALSLPPREPGSSTKSLLVPELASALQRAGDGAAAALELRGEGQRDRYAVFVVEDAAYEDAVRLLYTAAQAKLPPPSLGVRRSDGTLGALPDGVTELCPVDELPEESGHTARCVQATFTVVETKILVRGRPSQQRREGCLYVLRAKRMTDMAELVGSRDLVETLREADDGELPFDSSWFTDAGAELREPPPRRPPPPCRVVELRRVAAEPGVLHRALEKIASGEPCHQASLAASGSTRWRDVIMVFDAMRSLGHDFVSLEHSDGDAEGCEA